MQCACITRSITFHRSELVEELNFASELNSYSHTAIFDYIHKRHCTIALIQLSSMCHSFLVFAL
jgi:hypothetical protein